MKIPIAQIEKFTIDPKEEQDSLMKQVFLNVEGERLLATNGHMAARVTIGIDENDVSGLVPVEVFTLARAELKNLSRILGKDTVPDPYLRVTAGEDAVIVENLFTNTTHSVSRRKLVGDQKFPSIDTVFPKLKNKPSISLSAPYLAQVVKSLEGDGLSFWIASDDKAAVIACASGDALVVVMPRREGLDAATVSARGAAVRQSAKLDTTISLSMTAPDGTETSTPAMPVSEFVAACEAVSTMPDADLESYFREHIKDGTVKWPAGADGEQCQRIWDKLQNEAANGATA